jgi:hypothetical protein
LGWFGCVYFAKADWQIASLIFPIVSWFMMELIFRPKLQLRLQLLVLLVVGILFDSVSVYYNLIEMKPADIYGWLPLWLISLWLLFITSIPLLQSFLKKRYFIAAIVGGVFGPLSYRAGAQFDVLLMNGNFSMIVYSIFWALYIPGALFWLGRKDVVNEN